MAIGPSIWLCMFAAIYNWNDYLFQYMSEYYGSFNHVFQSQAFWPTFFLSIVICILPLYAYKFYGFRMRPTPIDHVRWLISVNKAPKDRHGVPPIGERTHELTGYSTKTLCASHTYTHIYISIYSFHRL